MALRRHEPFVQLADVGRNRANDFEIVVDRLLHHQVIVPVTDGRLDLGPWQAIFYVEFDGRRPKRLVIKAMGE